MATCNIDDLMADVGCFSCLQPSQLMVLQTVLMCQILRASDPMASCDVDTLLAEAGCIACLNQTQLQILQTQLLCEILAAGGGGGGAGSGSVLCGAVNPVAPPTGTCALYYNTSDASIWHWDNGLGVWVKDLG